MKTISQGQQTKCLAGGFRQSFLILGLIWWFAPGDCRTDMKLFRANQGLSPTIWKCAGLLRSQTGYLKEKVSKIPFEASLIAVLFLGFGACGQNTPSGAANNLNFSAGIAMYASSTPSHSFVAVTDYGIREVLLYPGTDLTQYPSSSTTLTLNPTQISPVATISGPFQGPSGVFVYPHATSSTLPYSSDIKPIPACGSSPALIVTDAVANSISIFCNFHYMTPSQSPTVTIQGSNTQLNSPEGVAVATVPPTGGQANLQPSILHPFIFVTNLAGSNVLAFDTSQITAPGTYNLSPSGGINPGTNGTPGAPQSQPTELNAPAGIYFSNATNTLVVANTGAGTVNLYPDGAAFEKTFSNDPPPIFYAGSNTYISSPVGVWVNNNTLYISDTSGNILVWDNFLSSGGNYNPTRRINGPNANLNTPYGLTFDSINENLFVFQQTGDAIYGYNTQIFYGGDTPPTYDVTPVNPGLK